MSKFRNIFLILALLFCFSIVVSNVHAKNDVKKDARYTIVEVTLDYNGGLNAHGQSTNTFGYNNEIKVTNATDWFADGAFCCGGKATKPGYVFTGWSVNGEVISFPYDLAADGDVPVTFVAQWNRIIDIDFNGGEDASGNKSLTVQLAHDGSYSLANLDVSRKAYTLSKWQVSDETGTSFLPADGTYIEDSTSTELGPVTIKAIWGAIVNIDFNGGIDNNGQTSIDTSYEIDSVIDLGSFNVTKEGYHLSGWNFTANYWPRNVEPDFKFTVNNYMLTDIKIVALWDINQYDVLLDFNGGKDGSGNTQKTFNLDYASQISQGSIDALDLSRVGYTFAGWQNADGAPVSFPYNVPANDSKLIAQWTPNKYDITLNFNGGKDANGNDEITLNLDYDSQLDQAIIDSLDINKEGYSITSWKNSSNNIVEIPYTISIVNNTIYAQWTVNQYDVLLDFNGGKNKNNESQATLSLDYHSQLYQNKIDEMQIAKTGYTFKEWQNESGDVVSIPYLIPAKSSKLIAQWTINKYNVTLNYDGGKDKDNNTQVVINQEYKSEITQNQLDALKIKKAGYQLIGWEKPNGSALTLPYYVPANDSEIIAYWQPIPKYSLTYDLAGGGFVDTNKPLTSNLEVGSKITLPKKEDVIAPTGKYLSGWKLDTSGSNYAPNSLFIIPNNNVTFVAQYTDIPIPEVTLTFDLQGGSFSNENLSISLTIAAGESITLASVNDVNVPDGKLALTGWLLESSGEILKPGSAYTAIENDNAKFIAQYSDIPVIQKVNLTYDLAGGSFVDSNKPLTSDLEVGTKILLPGEDDITAVSGKYLSGWKSDITNVVYTPNSSFIIPNSDITFTAKYTDIPIPKVNLTFDLLGGSFSNENLSTSLTISVGESITLASAKDVNLPEGKLALTGWLLESSGEILKPGSTYTAIENLNAKFIAQYSDIPVIQKVNLTYDLAGGSFVDTNKSLTLNIEVDSTITIPKKEEVNAPDGKYLSGWKLDTTGIIYAPDSLYIIPNSDVTFIAQYTDIPIHEVTLTFDLAGGSFSNENLSTSLTISAGESITLASAKDVIVPEGKLALTGWLLKSTGVILDPGSTYTTEENVDVTFIAQYSDIPVVQKVNLTYDLGEGSFVDTNKPLTLNIEVGSDIYLVKKTEVKAPDGKYLSGWKLDITGIVYTTNSLFIIPNNDITFTAQYSDIPIPKVNITYDLAGGSFSNENLSISYSIPAGDSITLPDINDANVPDGKLALTGWLLESPVASGSILDPGSTYTSIENNDATFIAQYSDIPVIQKIKLTYDLGNGSFEDSNKPLTSNIEVGNDIYLAKK